MRIISGTARSRTIEAPKGRDTRPTLDRVRENLFNIIARNVPGARVLDLFAGSGALSLEALSRGAQSAVMVDRDRQAHLVEQKNTQSLGFTHQAKLMHCDWLSAVKTLKDEGAAFDLIFLDPPYAMSDLTQVTSSLLPLAAPSVLLVVEHAAGAPAAVSEKWALKDQRRYGYVGLSLYRLTEGETADE